MVYVIERNTKLFHKQEKFSMSMFIFHFGAVCVSGRGVEEVGHVAVIVIVMQGRTVGHSAEAEKQYSYHTWAEESEHP